MENKYNRCRSCDEELVETSNFCPNCGAKRENVIIKCASCGNVLTETDKFCSNCGAQRNRADKNHLSKRTILLLALLAFLTVAIVVIGNIDNASECLPTTPIAQEATEPTTEPTTEPNVIFEPDLDLFKSVVVSLLSSNFDYCATSGDETGFYIGVAIDGFADTMLTSKNVGYNEYYEPWVEVKNAMLEMYSTICDTAMIHGLYDTKITLMLLNDANHDNALLIIEDGAVSYDFLAN